MCHVSENPHKIQPLSKEEEEKCLGILVDACPESALALHGKRKRQVTEQPPVPGKQPPVPSKSAFISKLIVGTCEQLYVPDEALADKFYVDVVMLTYNESMQLCQETMGQCSGRWRHARSLRITASECYGLYTATKDWQNKFARLNRNFSGCSATRFGTRYEPVARDMYVAQSGAKVHQCGLVVPPLTPWLACSPDGVVESGEFMKLLEIKCPALCDSVDLISNVKARKLPYLMMEGENLTLKKRHKYYAQVQLSMTLLDIPSCDFVIYDKSMDMIHVLHITRDHAFCTGMVHKLGVVYFGHVLPYLKRNSCTSE